MSTANGRVPSLFLFHGGGPLPLLGEQAELVDVWRGHVRELYSHRHPRAIVVVSAHFHAARPSVVAVPQPRMIYDYGGFPPQTYAYQYPAPCDVGLSQMLVQRMRDKGLDAQATEDWGFDHGTFVPLLMMFPQANIPVVPVSVMEPSEDADSQLRMGEAFQGLADDGILLLGSGASNHSFKFFLHPELRQPPGFDEALNDLMCNPSHSPAERKKRLAEWRSLPMVDEYQPRGGSDHFLPLLTLAAAAGYGPAVGVRFGDRLKFSHFIWE